MSIQVNAGSANNVNDSTATQAIAKTTSAQSSGEPEGTPAAHDTVKLSTAAQIRLLRQQGQSTQQIASNLGLSANSVLSYLGISPKAAPSTPAPVVAPEASVEKK